MEIKKIEAGLISLAGAISDHGDPGGLAGRISEVSERIRNGDAGGVLLELIRSARPEGGSAEWREAWGDLFSAALPEGPERIIPLLLGNDSDMREKPPRLVLCINPGSTSTKVALYRGVSLQASAEVHLPPDFEDNTETRASTIIDWIRNCGVEEGGLGGIACRGGFVRPVPTGTYRVCPEMIEDLAEPRIEHASNMAIPIGMMIAEKYSGPEDMLVTTTDPVASDEMDTSERLTGINRLLRDGSGAHYLNQNAVHRLAASIMGIPGDRLVTVGAHLGGGISVVRHNDGRVTDLVNAFAGIPSANRSGNLPLDVLLSAIDEGRTSLPEIRKYLFGRGGLIDLAGTNDFRALLHFRSSGATHDQRRKIDHVLDFMAGSVAGAVMKLAAVEGGIDLAILTGGLSRSVEFTSRIKRRLLPYSPVIVIPGSIEHEAMVASHLNARARPELLKDYVTERDRLRKKRRSEEELLGMEIFSQPHLRRKENAPVRSLDEMMFMARAMVAGSRAPRIAIVGADNEDAVAAAKQANEEGRFPIAKFLLVGDYYEINRIAWEYDITVDGDNYSIVDADDPVARAVELLDSGQADLLMKGSVKTSAIMGGTLKYLKRSGKMRKGGIYNHVGFFQIPTYPKLLAVTDAALIPSPDNELRRKILENTLTLAGYLNIRKPRVAVISAVETVNPSVESSRLAAEFAEGFSEREDCIVEGPLSLDVAMDPRSAKEKGYKGRIRGNADILLMPGIEAGNVVYKSLTVSSGAYLAGAIVGAGVPIILTSRGDSARSKLASICLACIVAMKQGDIET
jgi:phosphate butyryltransferase